MYLIDVLYHQSNQKKMQDFLLLSVLYKEEIIPIMLGMCIKTSLIIDTGIDQQISCTQMHRPFPSSAAAPGVGGTTSACRFLTICYIIFFSLKPFSSSFPLFSKMPQVGRSPYALPRQHGLSLRGIELSE